MPPGRHCCPGAPPWHHWSPIPAPASQALALLNVSRHKTAAGDLPLCNTAPQPGPSLGLNATPAVMSYSLSMASQQHQAQLLKVSQVSSAGSSFKLQAFQLLTCDAAVLLPLPPCGLLPWRCAVPCCPASSRTSRSLHKSRPTSTYEDSTVIKPCYPVMLDSQSQVLAIWPCPRRCERLKQGQSIEPHRPHSVHTCCNCRI